MDTDSVRREELRFASADGASTIRALLWLPAGDVRPRGVVQLIHGMAEHVERYDGFARLLAGRGLAVCGDDHAGHGASADPSHYGCLPARNGAEVLIADEHRLRELASGRVGADLPHFLFGHSLGSYVARAYLPEHGRGLAGVVLSGTGTLPVAVSWAGYALARLICAVCGDDHYSRLLDGMGVGAYARAVPGPTGCEWLSHSKDNVAAYVADRRCGFAFSAGGYAAVTKLTARACSLAWARRAPHEVPLLFVAGAEDPVGDCGRGVRAAAELARRAGQREVDVRIYEGMRHEILNEDDGARVADDVARWIEGHLDERG